MTDPTPPPVDPVEPPAEEVPSGAPRDLRSALEAFGMEMPFIPMEPHTGKVVYERFSDLPAGLVAMADAMDERRTSELPPIPLSEREPEPEDLAAAGPCSLAWFGHEIPGGYWSWELTDSCLSSGHTHWLPASVQFLPARVQP